MIKLGHPKVFAFCFVFAFLCRGVCQNAKQFVSGNIFQTNYFIENHGQFDRFSVTGFPVKYAVDNGNDHIYFNPNGFIYSLSKIIKPKAGIGLRSETEREEEKKNIKLLNTEIQLRWLNANPDYKIEGESKSSHYFSYGDMPYLSYGYKKIIYKELYPNIDLVYIIPENGGIKYSLILRPGADLTKVKFTYTGKNIKLELNEKKLVIKNTIQDITETSLIAFYEDETPVELHYSLINNSVGFEMDEAIVQNKVLVIDPWIKTITSLTPGGTKGVNKGYDVDYDITGNLYVYGGGNFNTPPQDEKVAKYDISGNLLWTFNGSIPSISWESLGSTGDMGNFVVDRSNGKVYIGQGFVPSGGTQIVRLNTNGIYDTFASTKNSGFQEIWEMNFNCKTGTVFGMGGSLASNLNFGEMAANGSYTPRNITGINTGFNFQQDILSSAINKNNTMFVILASYSGSGSSTPAIHNHIIKLNNTLTGPAWNVACGYSIFDEGRNKPYIATAASNGFNALAANNNYLFYYDGYNLRAFNIANGSIVGTSITLTGYTPKYQGGIYVDECNNIYLGGNNGNIRVFSFNGSTFNAQSDIVLSGMTGKHIYDIKFNGANNLLYISGDSVVATVGITQICNDSSSIGATLITECSRAVAHLNNPDSSAKYTFLWYDSTASIIVRNAGGTGKNQDTLNGLLPTHSYNIAIIKDPLCAVASIKISFIPRCSIQNLSICDGRILVFNAHPYTNAGTYYDTLTSSNNTDSVIVTTLTIRNRSYKTQSISLCKGDTFQFGNHKYYATGIYTDTLINSEGCDSIITTSLTFRATSISTQNVNLCQGDTLSIGNYRHFVTGIYNDTLINFSGCDSIIITTLIVSLKSNYIQSVNICSGDTFYFNNHKYYSTGSYKDTLTNYASCDSVIVTNLTKISPVTNLLFPIICEGDTFRVDSHKYYISGIYTDTLINSLGCDSIIKTSLIVNSKSFNFLRPSLCENDTFIVGGHKYYVTGVYNDTLMNFKNCDSIIITNLVVNANSNTNLILSLCNGDTLKVANHYYIKTGIYSDTLKNNLGCDSIVKINLTVKPNTQIRLKKDTFLCELDNDTLELDAGAFDSYLWQPNGETTQKIKISKPGIYKVLVSNNFNCYSSDSVQVYNICKPSIFIPNAFSPNGDGINDYFKPVVISVNDFNMKIYDRWGELLFETDSLEPGWNGRFKDKVVQEDVYIYIIYAHGINNEAFYKKGTLNLVR